MDRYKVFLWVRNTAIFAGNEGDLGLAKIYIDTMTGHPLPDGMHDTLMRQPVQGGAVFDTFTNKIIYNERQVPSLSGAHA